MRLSDKRGASISWWEVGALCAMHVIACGLMVASCVQLGRDESSLGAALYLALVGTGGIVLGSFHFRGRYSDFQNALKDGWKRIRLMGGVLWMTYMIATATLVFSVLGLSQAVFRVQAYSACLVALPLSIWVWIHAVRAMRLCVGMRSVSASATPPQKGYLNELLWRGLSITQGIVPGKELPYSHKAAELGDSDEDALLVQGLAHMTAARRSATHREWEEHLSQGLDCLEEASGAEQPDPFLLKLMGSCRLLLGDSEQALLLFEKARSAGYEEAGQLALERALALLDLGRWEAAGMALNDASEEDPSLLPVIHRARSKLMRVLEPLPKDGRDFNFFDLLARLDLDECMSSERGSVIERVRIDLLMREIRLILDAAGIKEEKRMEALVRDANENKPLLDPTGKVVAGCLATLYRTQHGLGEER